MDIETARRIVSTFEDVNSRIFGLLADLQTRCSPDEYKILKREIARVSNGIDINIYRMIMDQYPEIDPLKDQP